MVVLDTTRNQRILLRTRKWWLVLSSLLALLILAAFFALTVGFSKYSVMSVISALLRLVPFVGESLGIASPDGKEFIIITEIRMPRVLAGVLVGSGLALAGVVFQGVFRNPMADPYIIGIIPFMTLTFFLITNNLIPTELKSSFSALEPSLWLFSLLLAIVIGYVAHFYSID